MLVEHKLNTFLDLINTSTNDELIWINGYLNGILSKQILKETQPVFKNGINKITIAYGTVIQKNWRLGLRQKLSNRVFMQRCKVLINTG
jgi:hypothetical protein